MLRECRWGLAWSSGYWQVMWKYFNIVTTAPAVQVHTGEISTRLQWKWTYIHQQLIISEMLLKFHSWYALSCLPKYKSMNLKPDNDQILLSWFNLILLLEGFTRDSSVRLSVSLREPIQGWHCVAVQRKTTMWKGIVWGVVWYLFFSHFSRPMLDWRIKEIIRDACLSIHHF